MDSGLINVYLTRTQVESVMLILEDHLMDLQDHFDIVSGYPTHRTKAQNEIDCYQNILEMLLLEYESKA